MTVVVYKIQSLHLKAILNIVKEKFLRSLALNKGKRHELAIFYDYEIIIYDLYRNTTIQTLKVNLVKCMEFNNDSQLMVLTLQNEIYIVDINTKNVITVTNKGTISKWYPFNTTDYVYANTNNELIYGSKKEKKPKCTLSLANKDKSIVDLVWYDSDENYKYVLVGFNTGHIFLCDMNEKYPTIISQFDKYSGNLNKLIWLKSEPGSFISLYKGTSRIAVWNVSRKSYKKITKYSEYPIVNCVTFPDGKKLLMSLENGEVQIYSLIHDKKFFEISPGHSETIFDMKFSPFQYGTFATCAYDGFIKIWDMTTDKVKVTLKVNQPGEVEQNNVYKIYSLKWSPNEKELLLTGDSQSNLRLWDVEKQKLNLTFCLSSENKGEVIGIDWNYENYIVATLINCVYVCSYEGKRILLENTIRTDTKLFQVKFSLHDKLNFAVACEDSLIRIYSITQKDNEPKQKLQGHTHKVFGVSYNPSKNILSSSSDDFKIGIWDIKTSKGKFLIGHTNNVRQMVWLTEQPNLLVSGSWDGTTRIWNIDYMICVALINEHHSDVYGMDLCPNHPFMLVTSSRDNSIRFWNYVKNPIDFVIFFDDNTKRDLYKKYDKLYKALELFGSEDYISKAEEIVNFFFYHENIKELFDILRVVLKKKEHSNEDNKLFYIKDLYSAYKSKILNLEFNYFNQNKFDYHIKRENIIKEAIDYSAKCGDWEKFCELSIEIGHWKEAIMASPHVSIAYWEEITKRYADYLKKQDNDGVLSVTQEEKLNASLISNDYKQAIDLLVENEEYEEAKLVWLNRTVSQIKKENVKKSFFETDDGTDETELLDKEINSNDSKGELAKITNEIVKESLNKGNVIQAACAFLSINRIDLCIKTLVRGNEMFIAFMLMRLTNNFTYEYDIMFGLLCSQIKLKNFDKALNVISVTKDKNLKLLMYNYLSLHTKLKEKDIKEYENLKKESNYLIKMIFEEKYDVFIKGFKDIMNQFVNDLQKEKINEIAIKEIYEYFKVTKIIQWEVINERYKDLFFDLYQSIFFTAIMLEVLNKNAKNINILFKELFRINKLEHLSSNEEFIAQIAITYYKFIKNKDIGAGHLKMDKKLKFDIKKLQSLFESVNDQTVKKYLCDNMNKFYYIKDEIFPSNNKSISFSEITSKIIKGKVITLGSFTISQSQSLEVFKFINKMISFDKNSFIPY